MNIYQKLIEVRKAVPYLEKVNEGYQFKFVSSSQTLGALKAKMDEFQLLLVPSITSKNLIEKSTTNSKEHLTEIEMDFTWINAEKPEEMIKCHWYGQGLDTGEKGVGKALTYAEKYFMLKFFNIPTDKDDPDGFQHKVENGADNKKPVVKTAVRVSSVDPDLKLKNDLVKKHNGNKEAAKKEYEQIIADRTKGEELDAETEDYFKEKFDMKEAV